MPWFKVDDTLCFHDKAIRAGNAAMGLWVRAGSWSMGRLSDGHIPTELMRHLGTSVQAERLVNAGLWVPVDGGFAFHNWHHDNSGVTRQPSRLDIEDRRDRERAKKAAQRERINGAAARNRSHLHAVNGDADVHGGAE